MLLILRIQIGEPRDYVALVVYDDPGCDVVNVRWSRPRYTDPELLLFTHDLDHLLKVDSVNDRYCPWYIRVTPHRLRRLWRLRLRCGCDHQNKEDCCCASTHKTRTLPTSKRSTDI